MGSREKKNKASSCFPLYMVCVLSGIEPFAWVPRGVYIGLPPGGTMVIRLGAGPNRLWLRSPADGARRLVGPAGCRLLGRQAGPTIMGLVGGWLLLLNPSDEGVARWAWLQCRRPAGDRCILTASCLLNGASPSRGEASRLRGAGPVSGRLVEAWPPSGVSLPKGAHRPWAALAARRG